MRGGSKRVNSRRRFAFLRASRGLVFMSRGRKTKGETKTANPNYGKTHAGQGRTNIKWWLQTMIQKLVQYELRRGALQHAQPTTPGVPLRLGVGASEFYNIEEAYLMSKHTRSCAK